MEKDFFEVIRVEKSELIFYQAARRKLSEDCPHAQKTNKVFQAAMRYCTNSATLTSLI